MIVESLRVSEMYINSAGRGKQAAGKVLWRAGAAEKWYQQHHPAQAPQDN